FIKSAETCLKTPETNTQPCLACDPGLITTTTFFDFDDHLFDSDVIDRTSEACAVRTLRCRGVNPIIEVNVLDGVVLDGDDGAVDGEAIFGMTCNSAGTAWINAGIEVYFLVCSSVPQPGG
ncbi:hypothetical protein PENTCL1PPCAC_28293, partial [Pristionchus entomophagus]